MRARILALFFMRLQQLADFLNRTIAQSEAKAENEFKRLNKLLMIIIVQLTLIIIEGWELLQLLDV